MRLERFLLQLVQKIGGTMLPTEQNDIEKNMALEFGRVRESTVKKEAAGEPLDMKEKVLSYADKWWVSFALAALFPIIVSFVQRLLNPQYDEHPDDFDDQHR